MSKLIVCNVSKLEKSINWQVLVYLSLMLPLNDGRMPTNRQIAKDNKLELRIVKEAVADLEEKGILEITYLSLVEELVFLVSKLISKLTNKIKEMIICQII